MVYWTRSHLEPCWILCHVHSYVWCKSLGPECLPASKAGIISIWNRQADLKFMANWVPLLALWPTMRCRCLCAKLSFLHKIHSCESSTLNTEVFNTLTFPNVESTLLIKHGVLKRTNIYSNWVRQLDHPSHQLSQKLPTHWVGWRLGYCFG